MDLSPFDIERIVIAHMLIYTDAPKYALPELTHDKFLYSKEGSFSGAKDHQRIWQAITYVHFVDKLPITTVNILQRLNEEKGSADYLHYLNSLETALHGYYRIRDFDARALMSYAERVDKAGIVYRASVKTYKLAKVIESPDAFAKAVNEIEDVTAWLSDQVNTLSDIINVNKTQGYQHISSSVEKALETADRVHRGERLMLLPVGLPSIRIPVGKLILLLGESNSGKSVWTHQVCLGAAIGLKRYGIQGCVAVNSMEEREEPFTLKLAGMLAGVNLYNFQYGEGISDYDKYRLDRALEYVATLPIFLDTTNILSTSIMDFRLTGLHASEFGPVHLMSVDYLERFDLSAEDTENKEQALDKAINHCAGICGTTGASMIVISQVTQGNSGNSKARIAGPDGTRGSRSSRFAADDMLELWNPVEMKKAGTDFVVPNNMNDAQPWMLNPKKRYGPKISPVAWGWQPEAQRFFDLALQDGSTEVRLFEHALPCFDPDVYQEIREGF